METNCYPLYQSIDSVIFDLDGTLWDASATCTKAWNEALIQAGLKKYTVTKRLIRSFSGLQIDKVFKQHFSFLAENEHDNLLNLYKAKEVTLMKALGGELYPHVKEVLNELRERYRLFIVSNCLHGYIENFIRFTGLENVFSDFEASGKTGLPKSVNIQLIIERNSLRRPVYVGDTAWDYEAALNNNIPFVFASYGFGKIERAVCKIHHLAELRYLLN